MNIKEKDTVRFNIEEIRNNKNLKDSVKNHIINNPNREYKVHNIGYVPSEIGSNDSPRYLIIIHSRLFGYMSFGEREIIKIR